MTTPTEIELTFRSQLRAPRDQIWRWIVSVEGISRELWPVLKMTIPAHIKSIADVQIMPGQPLFRSWVLLFGVLPIDRSDLTLLHLERGRGFVEQSPMISMALWRHERTLEESDGSTILIDHLTFQPRLAKTLTRWFIRTVFTHRHNVLRRQLG
jgi:ligand-binding SRPBCC domain-containing protein